jgi:hypothetical protein
MDLSTAHTTEHYASDKIKAEVSGGVKSQVLSFHKLPTYQLLCALDWDVHFEGLMLYWPQE